MSEPDPQATALLHGAFGEKTNQIIHYAYSINHHPNLALAILIGLQDLEARLQSLEKTIQEVIHR
jgi:hypothetical protein